MTWRDNNNKREKIHFIKGGNIMLLKFIYSMLKNKDCTVYFQSEDKQYLIDDTDDNFETFVNASYVATHIEAYNDNDLLVTVVSCHL